MARRSRGELMLLAAGGTLPSPLPNLAPKPASDSIADCGLCTDGALDIAVRALPEPYQRTLHWFEVLQQAKSLLGRRSERVTLQSVGPIVESYTGRSFKVEHLAQLKGIYPEAFDWQYVRAPDTDDPTRTTLQLQLMFPVLPAEAADSTSKTSEVQTHLQRFKERLVQFHEDHKATSDILFPAAELPDKSKAFVLSSTRLSRGQSASLSDSLMSPTRHHPSGTPDRGASTPSTSRKAAAADVITPTGTGNKVGSPAAAGVGAETPVSARKQLLAKLLSPAAKELLARKEAETAANTPQVRQAKAREQAFRLLPDVLDTVLAVFGLQGPSLKPLPEVLQMMCHKCTVKHGLSTQEAATQLQVLMVAVPTLLWLKQDGKPADASIITQQNMHKVQVYISRSADLKAVRKHVRALAVDPKGSQHQLFCVGVAQTQPPPKPLAVNPCTAATMHLPVVKSHLHVAPLDPQATVHTSTQLTLSGPRQHKSKDTDESSQQDVLPLCEEDAKLGLQGTAAACTPTSSKKPGSRLALQSPTAFPPHAATLQASPTAHTPTSAQSLPMPIDVTAESALAFTSKLHNDAAAQTMAPGLRENEGNLVGRPHSEHLASTQKPPLPPSSRKKAAKDPDTMMAADARGVGPSAKKRLKLDVL